MRAPNIRPAGPGDYHAVVAIYNHYIETSHATFDLHPYSLGERAPWFAQFSADGPYQLLVAEEDGALLGYCCSTPFKDRAAYDVSVETSAYLDAAATGRGVGRRLYESLLDRLAGIGLHGAYAGIALPNEPSVRLHEALGFRKVGHYEEVGRKFGKFWSVAWYEIRSAG